MFSRGRKIICYADILQRINEGEIASYYLGIKKIPCLIKSPLRVDNKPSFSLYSPDGKKVNYIDFSTNERGSLLSLLAKLWGIDKQSVIERISNTIEDAEGCLVKKSRKNSMKKIFNKTSIVECKIRKWEDYDIKYWESYGISLKWLKYADVYPISHKIVTKGNETYVFPADKYAYAFVERKDGNTTLKIYQPFNKEFKWLSKHNSSVISLWTKVPKEHPIIAICSSLKDALCLWSNTGIPAVAVQGEGYTISKTAIKELKKRFKYVCICFDNDKPGIKDAKSLSKKTGFINVVLSKFKGGKDISDYFKILNNKQQFTKDLTTLFKKTIVQWKQEKLP
jgi:hypothetical protein